MAVPFAHLWVSYKEPIKQFSLFFDISETMRDDLILYMYVNRTDLIHTWLNFIITWHTEYLDKRGAQTLWLDCRMFGQSMSSIENMLIFHSTQLSIDSFPTYFEKESVSLSYSLVNLSFSCHPNIAQSRRDLWGIGLYRTMVC